MKVGYEHPSGTCLQASCPISVGGAPCLKNLPPLDCDFFEPEPDFLASSAAEANFQTSDGLGSSYEPDSRVPSEQTDARHQQSDREELPDGETNYSNAGNRPTIGAPTVQEFRRVRRPEGPKNTVRFDDGPLVPIASGLALTVAEAREVLATEPSILVAIAGPPDAGKTTLLAAIYESLLTKPLGNWTFAGSRTLLAFGIRSWWATTSSGGTTPETARTRYDVNRPWIHLRLVNHLHPERVRSMLVADISGEYFSTVGGGGDLAEAASLMLRADHVIHVLDAELFQLRRERLRALAATERLISRLVSAPHVSAEAKHTIVMTKADVCPPDFREKALQAAGVWAERWLQNAAVIEIASRPVDHQLEPWGLDDLLDSIFAGQNSVDMLVRPRVGIRESVQLLADRGVALTSPKEGN